ncbi:MAG: transposase, partial [Verrucomicrobiae bacterium]|nr:transposase [Verrucomicrobiae bacterium]
MAQCRDGGLGYNQATCIDCDHQQWFASSCGDRHCPKCLGPRQLNWSDNVCRRLPDCPHFHVVFTMPEPIHEFFELNYRIASELLFAAAGETLKKFQTNNWKMNSGFLAVLHTWGQRLNWHPHLHVLVSSGGMDLSTGRWKATRKDYMFPVKSMSRVMRGEFLRRLEELEEDEGVVWPEELESPEQRRNWRLRLACANWNIFSRATLGNTRAVVRYLARYTSRIAISNQRITQVDAEQRTVTFEWKDYRNGGSTRETTMEGGSFLRQFTRHLVPKGLRRIRYFGLLAKPCGEAYEIAGGPGRCIAEKSPQKPPHTCSECQGQTWKYEMSYRKVDTTLIDCLFHVSSYGVT